MNAVENKVERAITGLSENFLKIAEDIEVFPDFHATLTRAEIVSQCSRVKVVALTHTPY